VDLRAKKALIISFIITIVLILSLLFHFRLYILSYALFQGRFRSHKRLLCKTDYKLLLKACRELPKPIQNPGRRYYSAKSISKNPPEGMSSDSKKIIFNLNPTTFFVDETGRIVVDLGNSHWSFGVNAYPEDFNEPFFYYGDRELVPSLWYYDEKYNYDPNYSNEIEAMIQRNMYR
jgi:hypothetical protein